MRLVLALGGNALLRRGEPLEAARQRRNLERVAGTLASVARQHEVIVTHGNGPQVGLLALQAAAYKDVAPYPLDILGAESEGMIGYLIEQALSNELPGREIATLLTQVEVDLADPAFARPTKPIGPVYREAEMRGLAAKMDWRFCKDGPGFRRVVPSPEPRRIREINVIRRLTDAGVLVVCAGGGGIPVTGTAGGGLRGVEAVIDKDLAAALLAAEIGAEALLLLTDVPAVFTRWPTDGVPIGRTTVAQLRGMKFEPGSMGPKVEAACRFADKTGGLAGIGAIDQAGMILDEMAGTIIPAQR
jgi:carbamate kinase